MKLIYIMSKIIQILLIIQVIIIVQVFHIIQILKIINKTLMNQLTDHLTKQKITSTDQ